ncbi:MAG: sulfite exporter TauE/SafE family protein [Actinomycetes bacterium]
MLQAVELLLAGAVIGVLLGVLGGGGAIFTAPLLIYAFGVAPLEATTVSLVVVLLAAASGLVGHARAKTVRWREGTLFGLVGIAGSVVGALLAGRLPEQVLLGGFAVLLLAAAYAMYRPPVRADDQGHDRRPWVTVVAAALAVGLVTGFFGVGGGFVIVPALVLVLGFSMPAAAATGLLVIAINSLAALAVRGSQYLDWSVALPMATGAVVGSFAGSRLAPHVPARRLQVSFAGLMVATAVFVGARTALG